MGQHLADLRTGQPALNRPTQIGLELVVVAHGRQGGDGDQAAVADAQIGAPPQVVEYHLVGELHEPWRDGAELLVNPLSAGRIG